MLPSPTPHIRSRLLIDAIPNLLTISSNDLNFLPKLQRRRWIKRSRDRTMPNITRCAAAHYCVVDCPRGPCSALQALSHQQPAQSEEHKSRLPAHDIPQQPCGFIAIYFPERFTCRGIQEIHQPRIVGLLKVVQRAPNQPVRAQLPSQRGQLFVPALTQDSLSDSERAPQSCDDAADRRDLHLRCRVAHHVHLAVPDASPYRNPATIDRDPRTLPFQRFQVLLLEKSRETLHRVAPVFADNPQRTALR